MGNRPDLMRRFSPTPHSAQLRLMGRTIGLETNNPAVIDLARTFFKRQLGIDEGKQEFLWRIVSEADSRVGSADVQLSAFSGPLLSYVSLGQRGFLTVDLVSRQAIGFASDIFFQKEEQSRNSRLFDILFCMTAPCLGLTAMSGGCVALENRGVMVFGPPDSGKTTACYLAAKSGLEFHADQGLFLDMRRGGLHIWGDLFPAVFRPESLEFLPELRKTSRRSSHAGLEFYYFDKEPMQKIPAGSISPQCSVFLDRSDREPKLHRMAKEEAMSRLRGYLLFPQDPVFDAQVTGALAALAEQPAYSLQYGCDPKAASSIIARMLH